MSQRNTHSRIQLKKAFAELLSQKPIEQITVRDIVKQSGIARSTFYRNFENKDDFLTWLRNDLISETASKFAGSGKQIPDFEKFYQYASHNRRMLTSFLTDYHWPEFVQGLQSSAKKHYTSLLKGRQNIIPVNVLVAFLVGAHVNLFLYWLQSENPESPQNMAKYHKILAQNGILQGIDVKIP